MSARDAIAAGGQGLRSQIQPAVPDVVLAAAVLQPNAVGRGELRSVGGLQQRQLLKGECRYLGERILVGVTPLEVCATLLLVGRFPSPWARWRWPRDEVLAAPIRSWGRDLRRGVRAVRLEHADGRPIADLRPVAADPESDRVLQLLLEHRAAG